MLIYRCFKNRTKLMKGLNVMSNNYFAIERNGECWTNVILADENGNLAFEEFLYMSYNEMKDSALLEDFVVAAMDAANRKSGEIDDQTVVTLIGEDDVFIWGIMMEKDVDLEDHIRYVLVDWKKDGKSYKYAS